MALMFGEEAKVPDNGPRKNFVFMGYPYEPPLALDDYRKLVKELQQELPVRFWYFLDEVTTAEMMRKIWRAVLRSDLSVFDVTGGNANVAFELGLAVAVEKRCMTLQMTGKPNPLAKADLGYAERMEYTSAVTLKEKLRDFVKAKSSAIQLLKEISYQPRPAGLDLSPAELQARLTALVTKVFNAKHVVKSQATAIMKGEGLAAWALNALRVSGVLKVEGARRGARWVFTDQWVYHDHEVSGA